MGRRTLRLIGLLLSAILFAPSAARAQNEALGMPITTDLPEIPTVEMPVQTVAALEPPRVELQISPNTNMPKLEALKEEGANVGIAQLAFESTEYIDPRYVANSMHPDDLGIWEHFCKGNGELFRSMVSDYKNFYLTENILYLGATIAIAAPIANTHADQSIRDWYQRGAGQSQGAIETSRVFKVFGHWQYTVPIYLGLSFSEHLFPESPAIQTLASFGNRSLRALAVGAPSVGVLQIGLGAGRPYTMDSHWEPFNHKNSVAGHAFVGAVPFLTAASMVENPVLKTLLIAGSLGTGWSRIQDDDHYFSQVLLGWTIAYLSVESVNMTECQKRHMRIVPVDLPRGVGLGVQFEY